MIRLVLIASAVLAAAACHHEPKPMVVGGYTSAEITGEQAKAARDLAIAEIYKREPQRGLVEKITLQQQLVAGMNYRFDIKMTGVNHYRIRIYAPLEGPMEVAEFDKVPAAN